MTIISIDPGDHIGVVICNPEGTFGLTIEGEERNRLLWELLIEHKPQLIIYEQFALRQRSAIKMVGNKFIVCEVIGVVKLYCQLKRLPVIELNPSTKEYCGFSSNPQDPHYKDIDMLKGQKISEHVRDAYRLYRYAMQFKVRYQ